MLTESTPLADAVRKQTKYCHKCKTEKSTTEFSSRRNTASGLQSWCKKCCSELNTGRRISNKVNYIKAHTVGKCECCGFDKFMGSLEFHHRNPLEKENNPADIFKRKSTEMIEKELRKCDLLCSNCHKGFHGGAVTFDEWAGYQWLEQIDYDDQ